MRYLPIFLLVSLASLWGCGGAVNGNEPVGTVEAGKTCTGDVRRR